MNIRNRTAAAMLVASLALAAPVFAAEPKVLATVGSDTVTQLDLDQAINGLDPQRRMLYSSPEGQQQMVENLVDFKIFARSGRDQGLQNTPDFKKAMAQMEEQLLFAAATQKILEEVGKTPATDADAKKYYDEHQEIFRVPAAIRASHILIRSDKDMPKKDQDAAQKKAEELLREIELGNVTFEEAAKNNSADGSRSRGGDLGFFTKGQMVPPFEKAAFALKKGQMTAKPVKSEFGWHIIKVTDTRDASIRAFNDVKDDIKADLLRERQLEAVKKEREALRAKYDVKVVPMPDPKPAEATTAPAPGAKAPSPGK